VLRRAASALGLMACLVGLPVALRAAVGLPSLAGLPTWQWLRDGLRDQYLPVDPILHALGLLAWGLWAYAALVAVLRVLAVVATRRRLAGAAALLALSNLVTLAPVRGLLDASIGVGLLAASTRSTPTPTSSAVAAPVAVVRTIEPEAAHDIAGWDRARPLLHDARADTLAGKPALARPDPPPLGHAASAVAARPDPPAPARPPAGAPTRAYTVEDGDSLWRIAERELGDPLRWREIWALNQGRDMGGGRVFRRAGLILPGWVLHLPSEEEPVAPPTSPPPPAEGERHGDTAATPPDSPAPTTAPPNIAAPATSAARPPPRPAPTSHGGNDQADHRPSAPGPASPAVELPSGAIVGLSLAAGIVLALAAARLQRRRRRPLGEPRPGITHTDPLVTPAVRRLRRAAHAASHPDPDQASNRAAEGASAPPLTAPPRAEAPSRPGIVPLGQRGEHEVTVDLTAGGLALTGPTALGVARALVTALLAGAQPDAVEVLLAGQALADELFAAAGPVPGLRVADDLDAALSAIEVEMVHRLRLLQGHDAGDVAGYLEVDPAEPLPTMVLVADLAGDGAQWARRLAAVLTVGGRLGVGALLLGRVVGVPTVALGPQAEVQDTEPDGARAGLLGVRAFTLELADAGDLLTVVAAGRGAAGPPDEPAPAAPPRTMTQAAPASRVPPGQRPIRVRCLGPLRIELNGAEVRTGLRSKARELLAFLLLHPDGVAREVAIEALWPEAEPGRGAERAKDALKSLRQVLRAATGQSGATMVELVGERWRVNPELVDCDVWEFQAALADAAAADGQAKLDALARAAALYGGTLLDGEEFEWLEEAREELRRQAADVAGRLAELREQAGDLDGAIAALKDGARWDAYNEELYQCIMRLQARLGRLDAVRRTYARLQERLADLGADPDEATERLLHELRRGSTTRQ
jgi:DNA-binding SARP family transcriptional activator